MTRHRRPCSRRCVLRICALIAAEKCVALYSRLLEAGVHAELHVFGKGGHGFDLGTGRGASAALWPSSFVAWLRDLEFIED